MLATAMTVVPLSPGSRRAACRTARLGSTTSRAVAGDSLKFVAKRAIFCRSMTTAVSVPATSGRRRSGAVAGTGSRP